MTNGRNHAVAWTNTVFMLCEEPAGACFLFSCFTADSLQLSRPPTLFLFNVMVGFDGRVGSVKTVGPFGTKFSTFVTVNYDSSGRQHK
jgi:hypothetical protein